MGVFDKIKNAFQWPSAPSVVRDNKDLSKWIAPTAIARLKQDVASWRNWLVNSELPWYPQRVLMQQGFNDVVLNAHVQACMQRRKNLTLLKEVEILKGTGDKDEALSEMFNKKWVYDCINYILDANYFGYTLIKLGPTINNEFPELGIVRRANVSPDRLNVTTYPYAISGEKFLEDPYHDWHIWVPTITEVGAQVQTNPCGYGLLYPVAFYEIFLRNLTGNNGDYVEVFGQPLKHAKSSKREGAERDYLETALQSMAGNSYIITDPDDEIDFKDGSTGRGNEIYGNFEERLEKKISKVLLGHADALDSTPGKLGAEDAGAQALRECGSKDVRIVEYVFNHEIFPRLRNIGFQIPEDAKFKIKNDNERIESRQMEDAANLATATMVKAFKDAGFDVTKEWIEKRTGLLFEGEDIKEGQEGAVSAQPDVEGAAKAQLRGSIGGVQGMLQLQASVAAGTTNYDAAIAILMIVYGYDEGKAKQILGKPKPTVPLSAKLKNKLNELYS